mmetsp:Transcript_1844/g.3828  ORF Transcript_1844/g.3828 Transcript_1844/m.3828 type:complete len:260 (-) Transcript_1844:52-831(-)
MIDTSKKTRRSKEAKARKSRSSSRIDRDGSFYGDKVSEAQLMEQDLSSSSEHSTFDVVAIMTKTSSERDLTKNKKSKKKQKKSKKQQKSVSFGEINNSVHEFERVSCPQDVWWTDEESNLFRHNAMQVVVSIHENEEYLWALNVMTKQGTKKQQQQQQQQHAPTTGEVDEATHILVQHPEARGLEGTLRGAMGCRHVHDHADAVFQEAYESEMDAAAIRKQSRAASKACRIFAATMADFDAQEAAVVHVRKCQEPFKIL